MPSKVKQDSNEQLKSPDYQFSAASEFLRHCLQLKKYWIQNEVFKSSKIASKTAQIDKTFLGKNKTYAEKYGNLNVSKQAGYYRLWINYNYCY